HAGALNEARGQGPGLRCRVIVVEGIEVAGAIGPAVEADRALNARVLRCDLEAVLAGAAVHGHARAGRRVVDGDDVLGRARDDAGLRAARVEGHVADLLVADGGD